MNGPRAGALLLVLLALGVLAAPASAQRLGDLAAASAAVKCAQAINRVGAGFVAKELQSLAGCTGGVLSCLQTKPGDPKCVAHAGARCTAALGRIFGIEEARVGAGIRKSCGAGMVDFGDVMSDDGVGFDVAASQCLAEVGTAIGDLDGLAACVVREHQRLSALVFAAEGPRARELLESAGVSLPPLSALPDHGGSGAGVNDPQGAGKAIAQCAAAVSEAGARFVAQKLRGLAQCVERVFTCTQTTTKTAGVGKAEKVAPTDCMPQAAAACDQAFARITAEEAKLRRALERRCAESTISYATLRAANAANLDALQAECAHHGVARLDSLADYEQCLTRQHACRAEDLLLYEWPRAQEMAAYVARRLRSDFCPETAGGVLAFVETKVHVDGDASGLDGGRAVAVSPDGAHVYVASFNDDSLAVFGRDATSGALSFVEAHFDGVGGVDGLNGARAVTLSSDGAHVYVASSRDDAVAVFSRDPGTGALTFVGRKKNGASVLESLNGARGVAVSPDGAHVYVVADPADALAVFSRDAATGALTFVERQKNGVDGVEGLDGPYALALSPDGAHVYVASYDDDAVAVFSRDAATGALTFVERQKNGVDGVDGLDGARAIAVSPDGAHVYVAASLARAVAVFERDADTGALTQVAVRRHVFAAADGLTRPESVTVSPDGARVYAASAFDNVVAGFSRDGTSGRISLRASRALTVGADASQPGLVSVTLSPDGTHLYVTESKHDVLEALRVQP